MLNVIYAVTCADIKAPYAEGHYAECRYAECCGVILKYQKHLVNRKNT